MSARNLVMDQNPFHLAEPPAWWLQGVFDFDPDIVVMPSRCRMGVWWLTRRKRFTVGLTGAAISGEVKANETDTAMFLTHRVEPVVDIVTPLGVWALDKVLRYLWERDTWAEEDGPLDADGILKAIANGGSKYTKRIEALEAEQDRKHRADQRDVIWQATGEGWTSLKRRQGSRISSAGVATRPAKPQPVIIAGV